MNNFTGISKTYRTNDKGEKVLWGECFQINGVNEGVWTEYYITGEVMTKETFVNGKYHGEHKIFHKNGNLKEHCSFITNYINGERKFYKNNGELIKIELYDMSKLLKTTHYNSHQYLNKFEVTHSR